MTRKSIPDIVFEAMADDIRLTTDDLMNMPVIRRRSCPIQTISALRSQFLNQVEAKEGWPMGRSPDTVPYKVAKLVAENPNVSNDELFRAVPEGKRPTIAAMSSRGRRILQIWGRGGGNPDIRLEIRAKDRALEMLSMLKALLDLDLPSVPDNLRFEAARLIQRIER